MEILMKKYFETLKKVTLFEGINDNDLQSLLSCLSARVVHYDKNQTIFLSGEKNVNVGIVLSGQVHIIKEDYYGNRHILANIDEGNLFGETFACADIKVLPVSVFATTESKILFIDYRKIITPCSNACAFHSKLIYNMLQIVSMKNILLNQKIEFTSKRTTREKLIAYLCLQAQKLNNNKFSIPFNRQELANYLSVDRSAMSAELCKLRDDGVLKFKKNQFELL